MERINIPSISASDYASDFQFVNSPKLTVDTDGQKGGFLCGLFSSSSNKAGLKAAAEGKFDVVDYLLKNNYIDDITAQDEHGNTILHYIAYFFDKINNGLLNSILNNPDIKSVINIQNNNHGDTPAMVALKHGHHKFVDIMYNMGANFSIKNNDGLNIETETIESESVMSPVDMFNNAFQNIQKILLTTKNNMGPMSPYTDTANMKFSDKNPNIFVLNIDTYKPDETELNDNLFNTQTDGRNSAKKNSAKDNSTDSFLQNVIDKENNKNIPSENTDSFLKRLENNINNNNNNNNMLGGGDSITNSTENYLNALLGRYDSNNFKGGNNVADTEDYIQSIINNYEATMSGGGSCSDELSFQYGGKPTQLSRMIARQNKNIHKEVVDKIQKILEVSEDKARNYKSLLWDMIKKKFPKLSNMDQSIEMDKFVTEKKGNRTLSEIKKDLKKFEKDLSKGEKIRKEHREISEKKREEKAKKTSETPENTSSENISDTTSVDVPDASYSPLSINYGIDSYVDSEDFY